MKKHNFINLSILLVFVLCILVFVSCSEKKPSTEPQTNAETNEQTEDDTESNAIILDEGATLGLNYKKRGDHYYVSGAGTSDATEIVISSTCNGLPVTSVFLGNNTKITSVIIPDSVESVNFQDCTSLKEIKLGNGIKKLPDFAFSNCTSLTKIEIPNVLEKFGDRVFNGCTSLVEITIPGVPDELNGFSGCDSLKKVTLGDGVTKIGKGCFKGQKNLESITLGNNVVYIGASAFEYCTSLKEIDIPDSVTYIGESAFTDCYEIKSIAIPQGVTSISNKTFLGCSNLQTVTGAENVATIGVSAFSGCHNLESIELSESLTCIASGAFYGCYELNQINLGSKLTSIEENAFANCFRLVEISNRSQLNIEKGSSDLGGVAKYAVNIYDPDTEQSKLCSTDDGFVFLKDLCLLVDYDGKEYIATMPDKIEDKEDYTVNDYAFYQEKNLYRLIFGSNKITLNYYAISECDDLVSIVLCNFSEYVHLEKCDKVTERLEGGVYSSTMEITADGYWFYQDNLIAYSGEETNITLPVKDSKYRIGSAAFRGTDITSVVIPENAVTEIGESAFSNCSSLTSVSLPEGITSIGGSAFSSCSSLISVNIPKTVVSIGGAVFSNCNALKPENGVLDNWYIEDNNTYTENETIPEGVVGIIDSAFHFSNLKSIVLPSTLKYIGEGTFYGCSALEEISLPANLQTIGARAFSECRKITRIVIPQSVTYIGSEAFTYCDNLIIYAAANSMPDNWHKDWNKFEQSVIWGYTE